MHKRFCYFLAFVYRDKWSRILRRCGGNPYSAPCGSCHLEGKLRDSVLVGPLWDSFICHIFLLSIPLSASGMFMNISTKWYESNNTSQDPGYFPEKSIRCVSWNCISLTLQLFNIVCISQGVQLCVLGERQLGFAYGCVWPFPGPLRCLVQYFGRLRCCCWIDKRSSWNLSLWGLAPQHRTCILKGYFGMPTWVSTSPKATPPSLQSLLRWRRPIERVIRRTAEDGIGRWAPSLWISPRLPGSARGQKKKQKSHLSTHIYDSSIAVKLSSPFNIYVLTNVLWSFYMFMYQCSCS